MVWTLSLKICSHLLCLYCLGWVWKISLLLSEHPLPREVWCCKRSTLAGKSFPTPLHIKRLPDTGTVQLNKALVSPLMMCFSPLCCFWFFCSFKLTENCFPHVTHMYGFCLGSIPWCPVRSKVSFVKRIHISQGWAFEVDGLGAGVLACDTSMERVCSEWVSLSTPCQQSESTRRQVKGNPGGRGQPIIDICITQQENP